MRHAQSPGYGRSISFEVASWEAATAQSIELFFYHAASELELAFFDVAADVQIRCRPSPDDPDSNAVGRFSLTEPQTVIQAFAEELADKDQEQVLLLSQIEELEAIAVRDVGAIVPSDRLPIPLRITPIYRDLISIRFIYL